MSSSPTGVWPYDSFTSSSYTYVNDKLSCYVPAYVLHIIFAYLLFLTGLGCFITRVIPQLRWTHVWFGRAYIFSILWAMSASMLIHNEGLPPATLISFIYVLGGATIAYVIIQFYSSRVRRQAMIRAQEMIATNGGLLLNEAGQKVSLEELVEEARKLNFEAESRSFVKRFVSIKTLHGVIMFVSWINVAGRVFATPGLGTFSCYTYPVYKPINTSHGDFAGQPLTLVPPGDPSYARLPWAKTGLGGWALAMGLGTTAGAALVAAAAAFFGARLSTRKALQIQAKESNSDQETSLKAVTVNEVSVAGRIHP